MWLVITERRVTVQLCFFFFSSRRRHTRFDCDWSSGVCSSDLNGCLLLGMVTIMLWLNWRFALAALSVAPLLFVVVLRYSSRIKVAARQARLSKIGRASCRERV